MPEILKDIEESAFIAIDGEFTGLQSEQNIFPFDTSQEYYEKRVDSSSGFILVQLGLTFFKPKKDPADDAEKFNLKSYNIYVYPQSKNSTFLCQGSSLSFLASNGFDFNKLFTHGISYCNAVDEDKLRQEVKEKQAVRMEQLKLRIGTEEQDTSSRNFIAIPENEKELLERAREKIQNVLEKKVEETVFDKVNAFQRKLIYELIEREFNNKVSTSVRTVENRKALVVESKRSEEDEMIIEKVRQKEDEAYIAEYVGLRLLLKEISASKKLVVGHNCLLDLMFLIGQCFENLPKDYNEFKALTHRIFPNIIDTKFIGSADKFKEIFHSTVLNQLYDRLKTEPFKKISFEFENPYMTYSLDTPKEHEAGFDSFLTGYCLLGIFKYLNIELGDDFQATKCKELNPFLNRIALGRLQNSPFIYLTGKEATFSRAHVFFVKFPSTWQTSELQDHFKNFGPVHVVWVNNQSAFISLHNRENASCVLKTISRPVGFEIQSLAAFQSSENERKRDLSRKRKKEDSESSESSTTPPANGSKVIVKGNKKKNKAQKKAFTEGDEW